MFYVQHASKIGLRGCVIIRLWHLIGLTAEKSSKNINKNKLKINYFDFYTRFC